MTAAKPPARVLQLISSADFLGAERVVSEIARRSDPARAALTVGVISPDAGVPDRMAAEIGRRDVPVIHLPGARRFERETLREIGRQIENRSIQVLHSHNYKSDFYAWAARYFKRHSVRLLASSHTWKLTATSEHIYKWLDLKMLRGFDAVAAISEPIRDELLAAGLSPQRVHIVDNGIDLANIGLTTRSEARRLAGCPERDFVVGCVASLTPEKGHLDLLTALVETPGLHTVLAGEGPERPVIERFIARHNLASRVQLLGARRDVRSLYPAFDVFALASHAEGLPMVVLEAMGSGVPVVVTPVGALPRLIESGRNGLLVPPHDPSALREALTRLQADPALRNRLAESGQATVRRSFSSEQMAKRYEDLYLSLAAGN